MIFVILCRYLPNNIHFCSLLIGFEDSQEPLWHGILYACTLLLLGILQMIFLNTYVFGIFRIGLQMRSTLMAVIYRKVGRLRYISPDVILSKL